MSEVEDTAEALQEPKATVKKFVRVATVWPTSKFTYNGGQELSQVPTALTPAEAKKAFEAAESAGVTLVEIKEGAK